MNYFGLITLGLGFLAYSIGLRLARRKASRKVAVCFCGLAALWAVPALAYAIYYSALLGEPIWLYRLRTIPGSEMLAAPAGILAGWAQTRWVVSWGLTRIGRRFLVPVALGFTLALPYLKPLLRPLDRTLLREHWQGNVCLQSSVSTCGPACAATLVRGFGGNLTERQLAEEAFTCTTGTENWYLARALRRHGYETSFVLGEPAKAPVAAIAGVRLKQLGDSGHFIALLERQEDKLVIADPMSGLRTNSIAELEKEYGFTGFFLIIRPR